LADSYHPWDLTVPELLDRVVRLLGEAQGRAVADGIRRHALLIGLPDDAILEPEILGVLLDEAGIPRDLLGLDP
jgi:hypothetical protein